MKLVDEIKVNPSVVILQTFKVIVSVVVAVSEIELNLEFRFLKQLIDVYCVDLRLIHFCLCFGILI